MGNFSKKLGQRGFGLTEAVISIGIVGMSSMAALGALSVQKNLQKKVVLKSKLSALKKNIVANLNNYQAWQNTIQSSSNSSLSCISDENCNTSSGGSFDLLDSSDSADNTYIYGKTDSSNGFTLLGESCSSYDGTNGDPACPVKVNMSWEALCSGTSCTQGRVKVNFDYNSGGGSAGFSVKKFDFEFYVNLEMEKSGVEEEWYTIVEGRDYVSKDEGANWADDGASSGGNVTGDAMTFEETGGYYAAHEMDQTGSGMYAVTSNYIRTSTDLENWNLALKITTGTTTGTATYSGTYVGYNIADNDTVVALSYEFIKVGGTYTGTYGKYKFQGYRVARDSSPVVLDHADLGFGAYNNNYYAAGADILWLSGIAKGGSKLVAYGGLKQLAKSGCTYFCIPNPVAGKISVSNDNGNSWSEVNTNLGGNYVTSMVYNNGVWAATVTVGLSQTQIYTSSNLTTWTRRINATVYIGDLEAKGGKFFFKEGDNYKVSSNGSTWSTLLLKDIQGSGPGGFYPTLNYVKDFYYLDGQFVATVNYYIGGECGQYDFACSYGDANNKTTLFTSPDASSWEKKSESVNTGVLGKITDIVVVPAVEAVAVQTKPFFRLMD